MSAPEISVVIPVYNRKDELYRAINSVLKQNLTDIEIIVVDDHSEIDIKLLVLDRFKDSRIVYHRIPQRSNANVCRNLGIKEAKGKYVAMLDSDDEWMPDHLNSKLNWLKQLNADGVFGSHTVDNGETLKTVISRPFREGEKMINYLLSDGVAVTPTHFYKAECVKSIIWDENLKRHQDLDFSVRFAAKYKFVPCYEVTCIVHWKKGEVRNEDFASQMKFIEKYKKEISDIVYSNYHRVIYSKIRDRKDVESLIKQHYQKESIRDIKILSLTDYMTSFGQSGSIKKLYLRFCFTFRAFFNL